MIQKIDNPLKLCELKLHSEKNGEFEGYASVFNGVDAVKDTILPGAYEKTIASGIFPKMFINHDSWQVPVGDWTGLSEDSKGLLVKGKIDLIHKDGPTVYSALVRKAMDAMSIGFRIPAGGAEEQEDGSRIISEIDLKEISIVNFPADDAARISTVKEYVEQIESLKDAEAVLREAGFSKSAARIFVSRVLKMSKRDACDPKHKNTNDITSMLVNRLSKI